MHDANVVETVQLLDSDYPTAHGTCRIPLLYHSLLHVLPGHSCFEATGYTFGDNQLYFQTFIYAILLSSSGKHRSFLFQKSWVLRF